MYKPYTSQSVPLGVLVMLDKLNKAKRIYDQTTDEGERREADTMFADCYDWLTTHHIPIYYDQESNLWLRGGKWRGLDEAPQKCSTPRSLPVL